METLTALFALLAGLDAALVQAVADHGDLVYGLIWLTIYAETAFVVTVFLPGGTLVFAAAALAARGTLDVWPVALGCYAAATLGDMTNFAIGRALRWGAGRGTGEGAAGAIRKRLLPPEQLEAARRAFARHGAATVLLSRFVPILRAAFPMAVAMAGMGWGRFAWLNAVGKIVWALVFVGGGYGLGGIPWFARHFGAVVVAAALFPLLIAAVRHLVLRLLDRRCRSENQSSPKTP
jgi:membrane-associated protein